MPHACWAVSTKAKNSHFSQIQSCKSVNNYKFFVLLQSLALFLQLASPASCSPISHINEKNPLFTVKAIGACWHTLLNPLLSQHNGWRTTPQKNQSVNIQLCLSLSVQQWSDGSSHTSFQQNMHPVKNTNKNSQIHWNKWLKLLKSDIWPLENTKKINTGTPLPWCRVKLIYIWLFNSNLYPLLTRTQYQQALSGSRSASPFTQGWILDEGAGLRPSLPNTIETREQIFIHYMHWLSTQWYR